MSGQMNCFLVKWLIRPTGITDYWDASELPVLQHNRNKSSQNDPLFRCKWPSPKHPEHNKVMRLSNLPSIHLKPVAAGIIFAVCLSDGQMRPGAITEQLPALRCAPTHLSTWKAAPQVCLSSTDRDSDWIDEWPRSWSLRPWRSGTAVRTVYPSVLSRFCMLAMRHKREGDGVSYSFGSVCERKWMSLLSRLHLPWYRHL